MTKRRRRRRRRRGGEGAGIQNQKQEPHTKMWGKRVQSSNLLGTGEEHLCLTTPLSCFLGVTLETGILSWMCTFLPLWVLHTCYFLLFLPPLPPLSPRLSAAPSGLCLLLPYAILLHLSRCWCFALLLVLFCADTLPCARAGFLCASFFHPALPTSLSLFFLLVACSLCVLSAFIVFPLGSP